MLVSTTASRAIIQKLQQFHGERLITYIGRKGLRNSSSGCFPTSQVVVSRGRAGRGAVSVHPEWCGWKPSAEHGRAPHAALSNAGSRTAGFCGSLKAGVCCTGEQTT